jgi:excisionase family DNA binding protein
MQRLIRHLQTQFNELATSVRYDDHPYSDWSAANMVEDCRIRCCQHGFTDIGSERDAVTPREALCLVGAMLAWTRGQATPGTLTVAEAADRLQVCRQTIYSLCDAGTLACVRAGRAIRIPADAIEQSRQQPTVAPRLLGKDHLA